MPSASKKLLREFPSIRAMNRTIAELKSYGPQATAVMGAAYLERSLELLIKTHFRPLPKKEDNDRLFSGGAGGALGTFSNKIRIAYAGRMIIREVYDALLLMNDIRNAFAHSLHKVDFNNELVAQDCKQLVSIAPTIAQSAGILTNPLDDHPWDIYARFVSLLYRSIRYEVECLNERPENEEEVDDEDRDLFDGLRSFNLMSKEFREKAIEDERRRELEHYEEMMHEEVMYEERIREGVNRNED